MTMLDAVYMLPIDGFTASRWAWWSKGRYPLVFCSVNFCIHQNEPGELPPWLCYYGSSINIALGIIIYYLRREVL